MLAAGVAAACGELCYVTYGTNMETCHCKQKNSVLCDHGHALLMCHVVIKTCVNFATEAAAICPPFSRFSCLAYVRSGTC